MSGFHYWSTIQEAWAATGTGPVASINETIAAAPKLDNSWTLIKREDRVRLMVLDSARPEKRIICKIYRVPAHLGWRTLGMVSRANREFTALMEAHREGLPVACPHSWQESRTLGCVTYNSISLEIIPGTNLEDLLRPGAASEELRLQLALQKGQLLRKLHKKGLQWGTAFPRNIIVTGDLKETGNDASNDIGMRVIDTPYATWHGSDISGESAGLSDLRNAVQVKKNGAGFHEKEREQLVVGYCGDDLQEQAKLLEQLGPRSRYAAKMERWRRRCANVLVHSPRSEGPGGRYDVASGAYIKSSKEPSR